jgi:hypothetical protein
MLGSFPNHAMGRPHFLQTGGATFAERVMGLNDVSNQMRLQSTPSRIAAPRFLRCSCVRSMQVIFPIQ